MLLKIPWYTECFSILENIKIFLRGNKSLTVQKNNYSEREIKKSVQSNLSFLLHSASDSQVVLWVGILFFTCGDNKVVFVANL